MILAAPSKNLLIALAPDANCPHSMPRKPTKGYFVKGQFVAEGSELDLQWRRESGADKPSKTDLKRESTELQKLAEQLIGLPLSVVKALPLGEKLQEALDAARRISDFEGRRRQMQYLGKLMRLADTDTLQVVRAALEEQRGGSAEQAALLHQSEQWRDRLIADDANLAQWLAAHPQEDSQQLRALVRQARKDAQAQAKAPAGEALRQGRAYREIYQRVHARLAPPQALPAISDSEA